MLQRKTSPDFSSAWGQVVKSNDWIFISGRAVPLTYTSSKWGCISSIYLRRSWHTLCFRIIKEHTIYIQKKRWCRPTLHVVAVVCFVLCDQRKKWCPQYIYREMLFVSEWLQEEACLQCLCHWRGQYNGNTCTYVLQVCSFSHFSCSLSLCRSPIRCC